SHEHLHHLCIGASVQASGKCANACRDPCVHVRPCGHYLAASKRRRIERMVSVEHQRCIEISCYPGVRLRAGELPQEIAGMGQCIVTWHRLQAFPYPVPSGHQSRHARDEPDRLSNVCLACFQLQIRIISGKEWYGSLEYIHGLGNHRQLPETFEYENRDPPLSSQLTLELLQLLPIWKRII